MSDSELKRLLEGLFTDLPAEVAPAEITPTEVAPAEAPTGAPGTSGETGTPEQLAARFQAAARLSQAATSILNVDELLPHIVGLVREEFGYYYVGIFLVDGRDEWAILRAGTGEAGRKMVEQGHHYLLAWM